MEEGILTSALGSSDLQEVSTSGLWAMIMEECGYLMTLIISEQSGLPVEFSNVTQDPVGWRLDPCLVS